MPDPPLSELGFRQCVQLQANLQAFDLTQQVELIIASPMRRTLQTAEAALPWLLDRGVPMTVRGEWQGRFLVQLKAAKNASLPSHGIVHTVRSDHE